MTGLDADLVAGVDGTTGATGHPDVDAVLAALSDVMALPPAEQLARYAEAHRELADTLRTIDAN